MKTALDLPDELVREVKMLAVRRGRKLKDAMADLLRLGLDASVVPSSPAPIAEDPLTGLPVVVCRPATRAGEEMTADRVAETLIGQDAEWALEAGRQ